ncbi:MAG: YraN family protein [Lachnospiraceae bacterium]|nr:YraN family protein [Lachnospiraceae bacterium]
MSDNNREKGSRYEERAAAFLENEGMTILARNYRTKAGEIDIIAKDSDGTLVFVEVKFRANLRTGWPAEAVGSNKQARIFRAAQWYMKQYKIYGGRMRFDVVSVLGGEITHIKNAFGGF